MRGNEAFRCAIGMLLLVGCGLPTPAPYSGDFAFGYHGSRPGQLSFPRAVCATRKGWLFVIDRTGRVVRFSQDGRFSHAWQLPAWENGTPTGLCEAADGRLLIPDSHYHRVLEYDQDGNLLDQWGSYGTGNGQFIYPTDIEIDREGNLYVAEYGEVDRVQVFGPDRRFLRAWGRFGSAPGEFHRPMGLALTSCDELVVADTVNHRLQVFDLNGTLLRVIGSSGHKAGQLLYPYDVAVDAQDRIFVCEYGTHRVQAFARDGTWLAAWGGPGSALGQLANPWGLCTLPPDRIYIADYRNHRIQCWFR